MVWRVASSAPLLSAERVMLRSRRSRFRTLDIIVLRVDVEERSVCQEPPPLSRRSVSHDQSVVRTLATLKLGGSKYPRVVPFVSRVGCLAPARPSGDRVEQSTSKPPLCSSSGRVLTLPVTAQHSTAHAPNQSLTPHHIPSYPTMPPATDAPAPTNLKLLLIGNSSVGES